MPINQKDPTHTPHRTWSKGLQNPLTTKNRLLVIEGTFDNTSYKCILCNAVDVKGVDNKLDNIGT